MLATPIIYNLFRAYQDQQIKLLALVVATLTLTYGIVASFEGIITCEDIKENKGE